MPSLFDQFWPEVGDGAMDVPHVVAIVERGEHYDEVVQVQMVGRSSHAPRMAWKLSMCPFSLGG